MWNTPDHSADKENKLPWVLIISEGNILRVIEDLFIAGSESTSTSLDWTILYMIEYPEIQKKCQEEIEAVRPLILGALIMKST